MGILTRTACLVTVVLVAVCFAACTNSVTPSTTTTTAPRASVTSTTTTSTTLPSVTTTVTTVPPDKYRFAEIMATLVVTPLRTCDNELTKFEVEEADGAVVSPSQSYACIGPVEVDLGKAAMQLDTLEPLLEGEAQSDVGDLISTIATDVETYKTMGPQTYASLPNTYTSLLQGQVNLDKLEYAGEATSILSLM